MHLCVSSRRLGTACNPRRTAARAFSSTCQRPDHYKTLGIPRNAPKAQIKSHFYQLSKKHHPDVTDDPKSRDTFHKASEAYAVLNNDRERRAYDRSLAQPSPSSHPQHHTYHPRAPFTRGTRTKGASYAWEYSYRPRGPAQHQAHPHHPHQPHRPPGAASASASGSAPGQHYTGRDPFLNYHEASPGMGENSHLRNSAKRRADEEEKIFESVRRTSGFMRGVQLIGLIALSTAVFGGIFGKGH